MAEAQSLLRSEVKVLVNLASIFLDLTGELYLPSHSRSFQSLVACIWLVARYCASSFLSSSHGILCVGLSVPRLPHFQNTLAILN